MKYILPRPGNYNTKDGVTWSNILNLDTPRIDVYIKGIEVSDARTFLFPVLRSNVYDYRCFKRR